LEVSEDGLEILDIEAGPEELIGALGIKSIMRGSEITGNGFPADLNP
jgi:hypothetical protein